MCARSDLSDGENESAVVTINGVQQARKLGPAVGADCAEAMMCERYTLTDALVGTTGVATVRADFSQAVNLSEFLFRF